jgi:hypothetical protein
LKENKEQRIISHRISIVDHDRINGDPTQIYTLEDEEDSYSTVHLLEILMVHISLDIVNWTISHCGIEL